MNALTALQLKHNELERTSVLSDELSISFRERKGRSDMGLIDYEVLFISQINKRHRHTLVFLEARDRVEAVKFANVILSKRFGDPESFHVASIEEFIDHESN